MIENEIWEWVPWIEDFVEISNLWRVRSLDRLIPNSKNWKIFLRKGRYLKLQDKKTFISCLFSIYGQVYWIVPARVIYEVFWKNKLDRKNVICYKDWNYKNILLANLYHKEIDPNPINKKKIAKIDKNWNILNTYNTIVEAWRDCNLNPMKIQYYLKWKNKSFKWIDFKYI